MSCRLLRMCRTGAVVALAVAVSSFAGAKPPDVPAASREVVTPQAGGRQLAIVAARRVSAVTTDPEKLAAARLMYRIGEHCRRNGDLDMAYNCYQETLQICADSPYAFVAWEKAGAIDARRKAAADTASGEEAAEVPPPPSAGADARPEGDAARRMFLIGERCRREGDVDMACNCYREAQLLCPDSTYARQALKRLHQIEAGQTGDVEEQELPKPDVRPPQQAAFRDQSPKDVIIEVVPAAAAGNTRQQPIETEPPVLVVPPPPRSLTIHVDEEGSTSAPGDGTALDIDIEIAPGRTSLGLRAQGTLVFGKVGYKVIYDDYDGHSRLVIVPSKP